MATRNRELHLENTTAQQALTAACPSTLAGREEGGHASSILFLCDDKNYPPSCLAISAVTVPGAIERGRRREGEAQSDQTSLC